MSDRARRTSALGLALLLHGALLVVPGMRPRSAGEGAPPAIEIAFEVERTPSETRDEASAAVAAVSVTRANVSPIAGNASIPTIPIEGEARSAPPGAIDEDAAIEVEGGLAIDPSVLRAIDPRTVARDATREGLEDAARLPSIEERLDRHFAAHARARPHVTRRPDPVLRPTGDGGYVWRGPLLTARVAPNGLVEFSRDDVRRDGLTLGGYRVTPEGELVLGPTEDERIEQTRRERILGTAPSVAGMPGDPSEASSGVGVRARFRGLAERWDEAHGNDHLAAEKRWFLARTEAFRDRLAARSRGPRQPPDAGL